MVTFALPAFSMDVAKEETKNPDGVLKTKYAYTEKDVPTLHFFPVKGARWNGYELKVREWDQLTTFLKMRFLQDARAEIEMHENAVIMVKDTRVLLVAMNESLKEVDADSNLREMPVMKFFYIMLKHNNSIRKARSFFKLTKAKKEPEVSELRK